MFAITIGPFLGREILHVLALGVLLGIGAFFSGAETALFALSPGELFEMGRDRHRLVRLAASLMRQPDRVLTTVLLGTNISRIIYFIFSTMLCVKVRRDVEHGLFWASAMSVGLLLAVILLSEILPKTVCFLVPRRLAPLAAAWLAPLGRVVGPVQRVLMKWLVGPLTRVLAPAGPRGGGLSPEEMGALLALSQKRGLIGHDEGELLQEVLELTDLRAGDIMVPRVDVVAFPAGGSRQELLERMRRTRINKIPVYEGDLDHIVGAVYARDLLAEPDKAPGEALQAVEHVPDSAPLERVLLAFRRTRRRLAVVVDEYGGTAGIITLKDILEEVVGDIADAREPARGPSVRQVAPAEWLIDGDLAIHEWADAFPTDLQGARFSTVGGFVISLLGHLPEVGQTAPYRNVTFTVESVRRHRIAMLRVRLEDGREGSA
ncbi:MAG TPA: hemolysin family protein [Phycisphaerae bacterium]|nr:hemolysin family protein [Phycisphaerae bacterium]